MKIKNYFVILLITSIFFGCKKNDFNNNLVEKHALKGLVTMGSTADLRNGTFQVLKEANTHPEIYSGVVIKVTWGQLEPQRGVFNFSAIQNALSDIENYNLQHPNHKLGAKLRVSAIINQPDWVLNLANGPVEVVINSSISYKIGLFWTAEYRQEWSELQTKLAESFDNVKLI